MNLAQLEKTIVGALCVEIKRLFAECIAYVDAKRRSTAAPVYVTHLQAPQWEACKVATKTAQDFLNGIIEDTEAAWALVHEAKVHFIEHNTARLVADWFGSRDGYDSGGGPEFLSNARTWGLMENTIRFYMKGHGRERGEILHYMPANVASMLMTVKGKGLTESEVKEWIGEIEDASLYSKSYFEEMETARAKEKLEAFAKAVASKANCAMNTVDFIAYVYSLMDREEDRREGFREDGLCACSTMNRLDAVEEWQSMNNESSGREAMLGDLLEWFKTQCPLTWAIWEEKKLAEENAEEPPA